MTSAVLIVPAAYKPAADALGAMMGWGPENYGVALSASGMGPASHYLCRTDVQMSFLVLLLKGGYDLARAGMAAEQIEDVQAVLDSMPVPPTIPGAAAPVLAVLDMDLSETLWGADHAEAVLAARGLQRVREGF